VDYIIEQSRSLGLLTEAWKVRSSSVLLFCSVAVSFSFILFLGVWMCVCIVVVVVLIFILTK
jgi:hypothetical protein